MTWFKDLSPCTYFYERKLLGMLVGRGRNLKAVGWLDEARTFARGEVPHEVRARLDELSRDPWQPKRFRGIHDCNLPGCTRRRGDGGHHDSRNLFIPAPGRVYAAPAMLGHYIHTHEYRPPDVFCEAVLACPPMGTADYFAMIAAANIPWLSEVAKEAGSNPLHRTHSAISRALVRRANRQRRKHKPKPT